MVLLDWCRACVPVAAMKDFNVISHLCDKLREQYHRRVILTFNPWKTVGGQRHQKVADGEPRLVDGRLTVMSTVWSRSGSEAVPLVAVPVTHRFPVGRSFIVTCEGAEWHATRGKVVGGEGRGTRVSV